MWCPSSHSVNVIRMPLVFIVKHHARGHVAGVRAGGDLHPRPDERARVRLARHRGHGGDEWRRRREGIEARSRRRARGSEARAGAKRRYKVDDVFRLDSGRFERRTRRHRARRRRKRRDVRPIDSSVVETSTRDDDEHGRVRSAPTETKTETMMMTLASEVRDLRALVVETSMRTVEEAAAARRADAKRGRS